MLSPMLPAAQSCGLIGRKDTIDKGQLAAYMLLEDYKKACEAFEDGLKLDNTNVDIKNALRKAQEALKIALNNNRDLFGVN